jgi:flagellin
MMEILMSSLLTNTGAIAALQTLKSVTANLQRTQSHVSSGLAIQTAKDNAAYWSIATTMKSDQSSISAVSDSLGLSTAVTDTAYAGMNSAIDVVTQFQSKLVAAESEGVDKSKIQSDLDQLKQQLVTISDSASFSGQNWLATEIPNMYDGSQNAADITMSFDRSSDGDVSLKKAPVDLSSISLFNSSGGGILQAGLGLGTMGGLLNADEPAGEYIYHRGQNAEQSGFVFNGPLIFNDNSTAITFNMVVDAEDPDTSSTPFPGTSVAVNINRSTVDAVNPAWGGVISTPSEFQQVLQAAVNPWAAVNNDGSNYSISSVQAGGTGLTSMRIANVNSTLAGGDTGGLIDSSGTDYGVKPSLSISWDRPFTVPDLAEISQQVMVNGSFTNFAITKQLVDSTLGVTNGRVNSPADLAAVLQAGIDTISTFKIDVTSTASAVQLQADTNGGAGSYMWLGPAGNLPSTPEFGILDVNVVGGAYDIPTYLSGVDEMLQKMTGAAATLGSIQSRLDLQTSFTNRLMESITSGVGKLVDANMEEESSRLVAEQTQQQLSVQALSIANRASQAVLSLFKA